MIPVESHRKSSNDKMYAHLQTHIVSYQLNTMRTNLMQYLSHHSVVISVTELSG